MLAFTDAVNIALRELSHKLCERKMSIQEDVSKLCKVADCDAGPSKESRVVPEGHFEITSAVRVVGIHMHGRYGLQSRVIEKEEKETSEQKASCSAVVPAEHAVIGDD